MVIACTVWGLSPLYYAQVAHVPPFTVLCYRALWSLAVFAGLLILQRRFTAVVTLLRSGRNVVSVLIAAVMISVNWFLYIYAIGSQQGVEASLGYFIFPLIAVLLGRVIFRERLDVLQSFAIALACVAVAVLTFGLGAAPWIAIALAVTFGVYGLLKKRLDAGPVVSVTAEVLLITPFAVAWLIMERGGTGYSLSTHALLAFSGPLTAVPLILMSFALKHVQLSTIGMVQYLNPSLQFFCAVMIFSEPFTPWHAMSFPVIWSALLIYSFAVWRQERASRKAVSSIATSGTS